ncbi:hypothetical protein SteCoe_4343 [Stentor coeruleus]|uniref:Uncharacterized protein n=1 Tax=Stentor coeruleus TaxID=5963 RepID=A0A1R2CV04_9CILI|nr:hypothetical protein SteCoe_4343 [Stentor coeruleus]
MVFLFLALIYLSESTCSVTYSSGSKTMYSAITFSVSSSASSSVTLSKTSGTGSILTTSSLTATTDSNGSGSIIAYFTKPDVYTVTLTCPSNLGTYSLSISSFVISVPTTSSGNIVSLFTISGTLKDSSNSLVIGSPQVTLALLDGSTEASKSSYLSVGSTTATAESGSYSWSSVKITHSGSYKFSITSVDYTSLLVKTSAFTITNSLTITPSISGTVFSSYIAYTVTVLVHGEDNELFTEGCTILLELDDGLELGGTTSVTSSTGSETFSIYFTDTGSLVIIATATSTVNSANTDTDSIDITVSNILIKIQTLLFANVGDTYSIEVKFADSSNTLHSTAEDLDCSINLRDSSSNVLRNSYLSITSSAVTSSSGICTFENVRITKKGSYKFEVYSSTAGVTPQTSSALTITSSIQTVTVSINSDTLVTYFLYTVTVNVSSEGGFPYLEDCTITLAMEDSSTINGYSSVSTNTGAHDFQNVYFVKSVSTKIKASATSFALPVSSKEGEFDFTMSDAKFVFEEPTTISIGTTADIIANLQNDVGTPATFTGTVQCSLGLMSSANADKSDDLEYTDGTISSSNYVCTFPNVRIKKTGSYKFVLTTTSSGIEPVDKDFTVANTNLIVEAIIEDLTLADSKYSTTAYFLYNVYVKIKGDNDVDIIENCHIELSTIDSTIIGHTDDISVDTTTSDYTFTGLYFKSAVEFSLKIEVTWDSLLTDAYLTINNGELLIEINGYDSLTTIGSKEDIIVKFTDGANYVTSDVEYPCSLSLLDDAEVDASDLLECTDVDVDSINQICTFESIRIKKSGSYKLKVISSTSGLRDFTTDTIAITSDIEKITGILTPVLSGTVYFFHNLEVSVFGQNDSPFIETCILSLSIDGDPNAIKGDTTISSSSENVYTYSNIYFINTGSFSLTITAKLSDIPDAATDTVDIDVTLEKIYFDIPTISDTTTLVPINEITANLVDQSNPLNIIDSTQIIPCTITLTIDGIAVDNFDPSPTSVDSNNGVCSFTNLRITKAGVYKVLFTSTDNNINENSSNEFTVTSTISEVVITITQPPDYYTYFLYDITVDIKSSDTISYLDSCVVTLTLNDDSEIGNYASDITDTGTIQFTGIYFTTDLDSITITAGAKPADLDIPEVTKDKTIDIFQAKFFYASISVIIIQAMDMYTVFTVTATLGSDSSTTITATGAALACSISLYDSIENPKDSDLICSDTGVTVTNGVCEFQNVQIKHSGTYKILVEIDKTGVEDNYSDGFQVNKYINEVTASIDQVGPYFIYFLYDITVSIKSNGGYDFEEECSLSLDIGGSTTDLGGTITGTTSTGTFNFESIYLKTYSSNFQITVTAASTDDPVTTSNNYDITITTNLVLAEFSTITLSTTSSIETITVTLVDDSQVKITSSESLVLSIKLYDSDSNIEQSSNLEYTGGDITSTNGVFEFPSVRINKIGSYYFKVSSAITLLTSPAVSSTITIESIIDHVKAELVSGPYFPYNIYQLTANVKVIDNNDNSIFYDFLDSCELTLEMDDGSNIGDYIAQTITTGKTTFDIYFTTLEFRTLTVKALKTGDDAANYKSVDIAFNLQSMSIDVNFSPDTPPTTTISTFIVDANTIEDLSLLISGDYTCVIVLQDTSGVTIDSLEGTKEITNNAGGNCNFPGLRITRSGSYRLLVTLTTVADSLVFSGLSVDFSITSSISSITLNSAISTVSIYFDIELTVELFIDTNVYCLDSTNVLISAIDGALIGGTTTKTTDTGTATMIIYIKSFGVIELTASVGAVVSSTLSITTTKLKFIIEETPAISGSTFENTVPFSITVKVASESDVVETKNYKSGAYSFTLTLLATSLVSSGTGLYYNTITYSNGIYNSKTVGGVKTLSDMKVLSSGSFTLTASSSFTPTITTASVSFSVTNSITYVYMTSQDPTPTAHIPFVLTIEIFGGDENYFTEDTIIDIKYDDDTLIDSCNTSTDGFCTITMTINTKGDYSIKTSSASTAVFDTLDITVDNMAIELESTIPNTLTSDDVLTLTIVVKNSALSEEATQANSCNVVLSLSDDPNGSGNVLSGTKTKEITSQKAVFDDIKILSSGTFYLIFTPDCDYISTFTSATSIAVTNSIKTITLTAPASETVFFNFDASVSVLGDDDLPYIQACSLLLHETSSILFEGDSAESSLVNGENTYNIYFTSVGSMSLEAYCTEDNTVKGTDIIEILTENFLIELDHTPINAFDYFSVTVTIYNNDISVEETHLNNPDGYSITLELYDEDDTLTYNEYFIGTKTGNTVDGTVTLSNLLIKRSGRYTIKAQSGSDNSGYGPSDIFEIVVTIANFEIDYPDNIYTYYNFDLIVYLLDYADLAYVSATEVSITSTGNSLQGTLLINDATVLASGIITFAGVHFTSSGTIDITVKGKTDAIEDLEVFPITITKGVLNLSITSSPIPTDSIQLSTIEARVYDTLNGNLQTANVNSLLLYLDPISGIDHSGLSFLGDYSLDTLNGVALFENIRILSKGTFKFKVVSTELETGYSDVITITNSIKTINFSLSGGGTSVDRDTPFTITIILLGDDDNHYLGSVSVTLSQEIYDTFNGLSSGASTIGTVDFTLTPLRSGPVKLIASVTDLLNLDKTDDKTLTSRGAAIEIIIENIPTTSTSEFNMIISVYDSLGVLVTSEITASFDFICSVGSVCSGTVMNPGVTIDENSMTNIPNTGTVTYSNLKILSSGTFTITISTAGYISAVYEIGPIVNYVKTITLVAVPNTPSVNTQLVLNVAILGDDDNDYILSTEITLVELNNYAISVTTHQTITTGSTSYSLSLAHALDYDFQLSSDSSDAVGTVTVSVNKNTVIYVLSTLACYDTETFDISISVYDFTGITLETHNGVYSLTIKSSPTATLSASTIRTNAGIGTLNMNIATAGSYRLYVDDPDIVLSYSDTIIISRGISSILTTTSLSQNISSIFEFKLSIKDKSSNAFTLESTLDFSCTTNDFHTNQLSITTSNGTASYWLYFTSSGTKNCKIESLVYRKSVSFVFKIASTKSNNDPQCSIGISETICSECIAYAKQTEPGICDCSSHSTYNIDKGICECDTGYKQYQNTCVLCGWFFKPSEISGYYSEDYKSIILEFSKAVSQSLTGDCDSFISLPSGLKELYSKCMWVNSRNMQIVFTKEVPGEVFSMTLDQYKLGYISSNACSENMYDLIIKINDKYPKPIPVASIIAPTMLSLGCESSIEVNVYTKAVNSDYIYKWNAVSNPENTLLSDQVSKITDSTMTLKLNLFTAGTVEFSLTITSSTFGTTSSATAKTEVTAEKLIIAQIALGNSITILSSESLVIKPNIIQSCNSVGPFIYTWTYSQDSSNPLLDFVSLLASQKKSDTLSIPSYTLFKEIKYTFTVTIQYQNLTSSTFIDVTVKSSDLVLQFLRSSGKVSNNIDLDISVQAYDPDNLSSLVTIQWSCLEGTDSCKSSDSGSIFDTSNPTGNTLIIKSGTLRDGAFYSIYATASTNGKEKVGQIDLEVNGKANGDVKIKLIVGNVDNDIGFTIIPEIQANSEFGFIWSYNHDINSNNIVLDLPFIYIPAEALKIGVDYQLTLTIYDPLNTDSDITGTITIIRNTPPVCSSFKVTKIQDGKLEFKAESCSDDDSDFILYRYGYTDNNKKEFLLTKLLYVNSMQLWVPSIASKGIMYVCDIKKSCSYYSYDISNLLKKRKMTSNFLEDFLKDTLDSDSIPSTVIYYCSKVTDGSDYTHIYNTYYNYFDTEVFDSFTLDIFIATTEALLESEYFSGNTPSQDILVNITKSIYNILSNYDYSLTSKQGIRLFDIISVYSQDISKELLNSLYLIITKLELSGMPPGSEISHTDGYNSIYRYRNTISSILSHKISISKNSINFYNISGIDNDEILDIYFSKYNSDLDYFDLTFYLTGLYSNYNLELYNYTKEIQAEIIEPIIANIEGIFDIKTDYDCKYLDGIKWQAGKCSVTDVYSDYVTVSLEHMSSYKIEEHVLDCVEAYGPIYMMSGIIFLTIFSAVFYSIYDSKTQTRGKHTSFIMLYPITGLCINQSFKRRVPSSIQFFTSHLVLLNLIGVMYLIVDGPQDSNSQINGFDISQLSRGVIALIITQVFSFPTFLLNAFIITGKPFHIITIPLASVTILGCLCGILLLCLYRCVGYTEFWLINWAVFVVVDIFTFQLLYAYLIHICIKGKTILTKVNKVNSEAVEASTFHDVFTIKSLNSESPVRKGRNTQIMDESIEEIK